MLEKLIEGLRHKFPHHAVVLFSSFSYILCAIALLEKDRMIISFLLLVFLTSLFYHSHPHNKYFRLADWIASLTFIFYIYQYVFIDRGHLVSIILYILTIVSLISWVISFFTFIKNKSLAYNISHTVWHIGSSIVIYLIVFSS